MKEGLILEETSAHDGSKTISFTNTTLDRQFVVKYVFKDGRPEALGLTAVEGDKWVLSIHPGETQLFVKGRWKGHTPYLACGPPSKEWQEKTAATAKARNRRELDAVLRLCRSKSDFDTDATSEEVAQACLKHGVQFVDPNFPPLDQSLQADWEEGEMKPYPFKRLRDCELLRGKGLEPQLFVDKIEPSDVCQGALGNSYLTSALACLALADGVVRGGLFAPPQHPDLGVYRVSLCAGAWWRAVVVDDALPCAGPRPAFARNRAEPTELWAAVAEKAFAKARGSYASARGGQCCEAFGDLTGCPHTCVPVESGVWDTVLKNHKQGYLQALGTPGKNLMLMDPGHAVEDPYDRRLWEQYRSVDLLCEHSYSVVKAVRTKGGQRLVCLRNPWGSTSHGLWRGRYDQNSPEWTAELKRECGWVQSDGTFWMAWDDCARWFSSLSVGYLLPGWRSIRAPGQWHEGAGDLLVELDVKGATDVWLCVHQCGTLPGCRPGGAGAAPVRVQLWVAAPRRRGAPRLVDAAESSRRDSSLRLRVDPAEPRCGARLLVLAAPKGAGVSRGFVVALHVADPGAVAVTFRAPAAAPRRHGSAQDIVLDEWVPRRIRHQVGKEEAFGEQVLPAVKATRFADGEGPRRPRLSPRLPRGGAADGEEERAKRVLARRDLPVEIVVQSARGLSSEGSNNPFCELELLEVHDGVVGAGHKNPQRRQTRVVYQNLNPKWDEAFRFTVPGADCIRATVFGKKMLGRDFLGHVDLLMPKLALQLIPGSPAETHTLELVGDPEEESRGEVAGTLNLAIRLAASR